MSRPVVRPLEAGEFLHSLGAMREVFREALGYTPLEARVLSFASVAREHTRRSGFRAAGAFAGSELVGFAYGCDGAPGHWWYDQVARALAVEERRRWLDGSFELVELHVRPDHQGLGLGGALHDLLLTGVRRATAVLSTPAREGRAMLLYRARGWVTLAEGPVFEGVREPYRILGLRLTRGLPEP
jgi:ribosomal protein S18 acetylase RimI-like enzyme